MYYSDHDQDLLVWGVATETVPGRLGVEAHPSRDAAERTADHAPLLSISGPHPRHGGPCALRDVYPLVYHHVVDGWTFAAIGWPVDLQPASPAAHERTP